jgi:hypothetical protein
VQLGTRPSGQTQNLTEDDGAAAAGHGELPACSAQNRSDLVVDGFAIRDRAWTAQLMLLL